MNNITYAVSVDVNNPIIPYNVYVASVLDSNVRYLEITLYQNGNVIALSDTATATASLVTDDVLIDDSVECTISNNIITVPLEDLQRHGNLDVQVTVTEDTKVLAIPFPIQVRVTPNIAENAQIDENSLGSYAEVVHEIAEARGSYDKLKDRLDHTAPTEMIEEKAFEILDGTLSGNRNISPTLLVDNIVDQTHNPNGNLILYYIDSDGTRHNLFNFSEEFYTISEVQDLIDSLREFYAPRSETAPTKTVGFDADGIPEVILSATTFSAGACTNTSIKKLYVPSTVTRIDSGAFYNCTALTDVYIDNTATGITVNNRAFPSGVFVHYHNPHTGRMTFNAVDELIKAVNTFEEDLANAAY